MWLAEGPSGRCALKLAPEGGSLAAEADTLARAAGPGIVRMLDHDPDGAWIALEHLPGGRADDWARGQPLPAVVDLAAAAAEALAHLHDAGFVHADVKPANILVAADGTPRLIDFGSARERARPGTAAGGTPGFVAPERLAGEAATPAADLYGLGGVLYQMLTRVPPFRDPDPAVLALQPLNSLPEPPSALRPRLPSGLEDLVLALLARRPAVRPGPAREVAAALRASVTTPTRPPVVGMSRARERLRKSVIDLLDGRPSAIVLYGPPGSGRRTLLRETVRTAAREGVRAVTSIADRRSLLRTLAVDGPSVLPLDGNAPTTEALVLELRARALPVLTIVRADRPLPRLHRAGIRHVSPALFGTEDVARVLEGLRRDRRNADELARRSRGLPGALFGLLGGPFVTGETDRVSRALLVAVEDGPRPVRALAAELGLGEHALLDAAEALIDRGLLVSTPDGSSVGPPPPLEDTSAFGIG